MSQAASTLALPSSTAISGVVDMRRENVGLGPFLQALEQRLDALSAGQLREILGDDVLMHHEFAQLDGQLVAFDLPIVRYSTDERLYEIMDIYRGHGFGVSNPHSFTVETGGLKTDYRHLAWKRRLDPNGLLNMGKSRAWDEVGQLSPEDIEELQREAS
jgi:FAD/FMN-containing dehydrogenase